MNLDLCPQIFKLGKSFKDGKDEEYHSLNYHSLILIDGFCLFESGNYSQPVKPGDILIVPVGLSRIYRDPQALRSRHGHFSLEQGPQEIKKIQGGTAFRELCREFDRILYLDNNNKARASARFWELLFKVNDLISIPEGRKAGVPVHPALRQALDYIDFHFHEKIDMDELAHTCQISHNQLLRLFQKEFSLSIISYILKKRMDYAGELLTQTTLPIKEIRFKCGYRDSQHFNKAVRSFWSCSPKEMRGDSRTT